MITMKVSIIIPVWGVAQWVEECAESLMRQTYADIEYIFVDDCSPDDSVAIIRRVVSRYAARTDNVKIIGHDRNRGVAAARNTGTDAATGDAVMHVDGDDRVREDMVALMVAEMERSGSDVVECGYVKESDDGEVRVSPIICSDDTYLRLLLCQNLVHNGMWCRLMKRRLFTDGKIRFVEGVNYGDDFAVIPRLMSLCKRRTVVNECLYYYNNKNEGSYTHRLNDRHCSEYIEAMNTVFGYFAGREELKRFSSALDVAMVNVARHTRRYGNDPQVLMREAKFAPLTAMGRIIGTIMAGRLPLVAANYLYLLWRKWLVWKWTKIS